SEWALNQRRWAKRVMWLGAQGKVLKKARCLHATCEHEYRDIRRNGVRAPVAVIPLGVDLPEICPRNCESAGQTRRLLFFSRIHPGKGLDLLLPAWRRVQDSFPDWELHVVGDDKEGHLSHYQTLARSLDAQRVTFSGPAFGAEKTAMFSRADLY